MTERGNISGFAMMWLVAVAVGLFVGYLYWLKAPTITPVEQSEVRSDSLDKGGDTDDDQFHFDFFSMLPNEEYTGVEEKREVTVEKKSTEEYSQSVSPRPSGNYLIQLGAFRRPEMADKHKAKLILLGVENVQVEVVKTAKGLLYRVNVGPFQSFSSADHEQERLRREGYDSFLKKQLPKSQKR